VVTIFKRIQNRKKQTTAANKPNR